MEKIYQGVLCTTKDGYLHEDYEYFYQPCSISDFENNKVSLERLMVKKTCSPFVVKEILTGVTFPVVAYDLDGLHKGRFQPLVPLFVEVSLSFGERPEFYDSSLATSEDLDEYYRAHSDVKSFKRHLMDLKKSSLLEAKRVLEEEQKSEKEAKKHIHEIGSVYYR